MHQSTPLLCVVPHAAEAIALGQLLAAEGSAYRLEWAASPAAAAARLAAGAFAALLVDQVFSGDADLRVLRPAAATLQIPLLLVADDPAASDVAVGFDDTLPKARLDGDRLGRALRCARLQQRLDLSGEAHWTLRLARPLRRDWPEDAQIAHLYAYATLDTGNAALATHWSAPSAAALAGAGLDRLLPPADLASHELLRAFIRSGYDLRQFETQQTDASGVYRICLSTWRGRFGGDELVAVDCAQQDVSALRRAERDAAWLRATIESADDAIITKDPENVILSWNRGAEEMYGWTAAEAIGRSIELIVPPERHAEIHDLVRAAHSGEHRVALETVRLRKDGSAVDVSLAVSPLFDEHGTILGTTVIARDVGAALHAASRLRSYARSFRDAVNNSRDIMYQLNLRTQTFDFISLSAEELLGIPADELIAGGFAHTFNRIHPDDRPAIEQALRGVLEAGPKDSRFAGVEYRVQSPHRGWRWLSSRHHLILDASGQPSAIFGTARDITETKQVEEGLRAAELRYRTLIEQLPAIIYTAGVDATSPTTFVSPQVEEILGYTPAEWLADPELWLKRIYPEDRERVLADVARTQTQDQAHAAEFRSITRDGRVVWLRDSAKMARDEAGRPLFLQGITLDITDRKQIEESLRASEARLKHAQQIAHLAHFEIDLVHMAMHWSEEMFRIYGLDVNAPVPTPEAYTQLVLPDDRPLIDALRSEVRAGWVRPSMDLRIVRPNGELRHVSVQFQLIKGPDQRPSQLVGTVLDITDRVRAEFEVRESQERLFGIVNSAMDAVITIDAEQRITLFNPAAEQMFGYRSAEVVGQPLARLMPAAFRAGHERHVLTFDRHGTTTRSMGNPGAVFGLRANGQTFPIEASISQVDVGGQKLFTAILRDITEMRRAEDDLLRSRAELELANNALEQRVEERTRELELAKNEAERANAAKSDFLSRMSHELRTPMNSILGFAQIMEMDTMGAKQAERLGYILSAGQHLLQLINEVLDMERVEAGRLQVMAEPVAVAEAIKLAVDLVQPLMLQRDQQIFVVADAPNLFVQGDQQRLAQVVLNLLSNATKYSPARTEIRVVAACPTPGRVRISVRDQGPGIAAGDIDRLFQPFERLHAASSAIEGTGLGLALSKRLVELMGGTMGVDSAPGGGSVFWLELPASSGASASFEPARSDEVGVGQLTRKHTILYIEDNLANVQVLEHVLADEPQITLISAMQGQLGLDLAREHRPSLILLDLHLPDINGDEVLRRLQSDPATQLTPVVILSADAAPSRMRQLRNAGAVEFLSKPLDIRELWQVITELLSAADIAQAEG